VYNRYIPDDEPYTWIGAAEGAGGAGTAPDRAQDPTRGGGPRLPSFLAGREGLSALFSGGEKRGLSSLLHALHLDDIDSGDILLLLIVLYLLVEGDDLELVIALGLVLIMGLGEEKSE